MVVEQFRHLTPRQMQNKKDKYKEKDKILQNDIKWSIWTLV